MRLPNDCDGLAAYDGRRPPPQGATRRRKAMKTLLAFARAIDALNERCARIASWLVLLACLISCGNALVRYSFSASSNAWLEIQWYLFGALVMLGASWTLNRNEHVRVDVI
jgi:TRAP-type mannitol/chloroaromatic compound transport system permease small subunit